jgi:hypothetical protein
MDFPFFFFSFFYGTSRSTFLVTLTAAYINAAVFCRPKGRRGHAFTDAFTDNRSIHVCRAHIIASTIIFSVLYSMHGRAARGGAGSIRYYTTHAARRGRAAMATGHSRRYGHFTPICSQ